MLKKKILVTLLVGLVVAFVLAQLVPVERTNPPVTLDVPAPDDVKTILKKACYDCHSHDTVWPWYSRVAPVSWLVAYDVEEAREHLDFSTWDAYDAKRRAHKLEEVAEEVAEGEMPLWFYVPLHPEADLDAAEVQILVAWAAAQGDGDGDGHDDDDDDEHDDDDDDDDEHDDD